MSCDQLRTVHFEEARDAFKVEGGYHQGATCSMMLISSAVLLLLPAYPPRYRKDLLSHGSVVLIATLKKQSDTLTTIDFIEFVSGQHKIELKRILNPTVTLY